MTSAIKYMGGLPITALGRSANERKLLESAGRIPLSSMKFGKHLNAFKYGFFAFAFYVVGLEAESPDFSVHLVKARMFLNPPTSGYADLFAGFFLEACSR